MDLQVTLLKYFNNHRPKIKPSHFNVSCTYCRSGGTGMVRYRRRMAGNLNLEETDELLPCVVCNKHSFDALPNSVRNNLHDPHGARYG